MYASPELFEKKPVYSAAGDMWALGCIGYYLCCLELPFISESTPSLINMIVNSVPDPIDTVAEVMCLSPSAASSFYSSLSLPLSLTLSLNPSIHFSLSDTIF